MGMSIRFVLLPTLWVSLLLTVTVPANADASSWSIKELETQSGDAFWQAYQDAFVTSDGRVIDTANGDISHSEGQGYGLLLAAFADDQKAFDRIWYWTKRELQVRQNDHLLAWRWKPDASPHVDDLNNATDGELLIVYALIEAAKRFNEPSYLDEAAPIALDMARTMLWRSNELVFISPAERGFSADERSDGPIVNPSYWVFPALSALESAFDGEDVVSWQSVAITGLGVLEISSQLFGLPPEWLALGDGRAAPASGFDPVFGYNAVRVPLYLTWAGLTDERFLQPFSDNWIGDGGELPIAHLLSGEPSGHFVDAGYRAVAALTLCALDAAPFASDLKTIPIEHYYPTTLHAFSLMIAQGRYPQCL